MRRLGTKNLWAICPSLALCLFLASFCLADDSARLVRATPSVVGGRLVCRLETAGLPGEKQLQSMKSGLISSVDLNLALENEAGNIVGGQNLSLRMGFDLWEEIFSLDTDGHQKRFKTLDDLQKYLAEINDLPVGPYALVGTDGKFRLRVSLTVHSIAPEEQARVEDVIAGDRRPHREGQDQQETSVSLGHLIRFFYKGEDQGDGQDLQSPWFTRKDLANAPH